MRNIVRRSLAVVLMCVMFVSCFDSALFTVFAEDDVIVSTEVTEPSESTTGAEESSEAESSEAEETSEDNPSEAEDASEVESSTSEETSEVVEELTEPEDPSSSEEPTESEAATESTGTIEETEPSESASEEVTEEVTEESTAATEPPFEVEYTKMEAETDANIFNYAEEPENVEGASNGYVVSGQIIEDIYSLEMYDDLPNFDLKNTPFVKFNVEAETAGLHTFEIGVQLEGLKNKEDSKIFYIPVVVGQNVYKAVCNDYNGEDGFYKFTVDVGLEVGKNEIKCISFDADLYLELIDYELDRTLSLEVNFDYLGIPEGVNPLEKDETFVPEEDEELVPVDPEDEATTSDGEVTDADRGGSISTDLIIPTPEIIDPSNGNELMPMEGSDSGSSGSNIGGNAGGGQASPPGTGNLHYTAVGVTMQVVTYPYGETYTRTSSYNNVINTVQNYKVNGSTTVYDGQSVTQATFVVDPVTGRVFRLPNFNTATKSGTISMFQTGNNSYVSFDAYCYPSYCVSGATVSDVSTTKHTVTMNPIGDVEAFLLQIILGADYPKGSWDKNSVALDSSGITLDNGRTAPTQADDVSLFAKVLRMLGTDTNLINNYVKGYTGQLNKTADYNVQIPTIIWSYVTMEMQYVAGNPGANYFGMYNHKTTYTDPTYTYGTETMSHTAYNYQVYTVKDIFKTAATNSGMSDAAAENNFTWWWKNSGGYASPASNRSGYRANASADGGTCYWPAGGSFACVSMFGTHNHTSYTQRAISSYMLGSGYVNSINSQGVDASTGKQYYHRGYWTPYGQRLVGELTVQKKTSSGSTSAADLQNWKMELYKSLANAQAGVNCLKVAYTDAKGVATFTGLEAGKYYIKEAAASKQDRRNVAGWTVNSDTVCSGTVVVDETISAGEIVNGNLGSIQVKKAISTGSTSASDLQGWKMELYQWLAHAESSDANYVIATAYTDSNGIATFTNVVPGQYYIKEAPASRQDKHATSGWVLTTVILDPKLVGGETVSAGTLTNEKVQYGNITVQKVVTRTESSGANLSGWVIELYGNSTSANNGTASAVIASAKTNNQGVVTFTNLEAGKTYYVREAPISRQTRADVANWTLSASSQGVTVVANSTVKAGSISNSKKVGSIKVQKLIASGSTASEDLSGWVIHLYSSSADMNSGINYSTGVTGSTGVVYFTGLEAGKTYYVKEAPASEQTRADVANWTLDADSESVTVTTNSTETVSFTNTIKTGSIKVKKVVSNATTHSITLKGWVIELYTDEADAEAGTNPYMSATTDESGIVTFDGLPAGKTYYVREAPASRQTRTDVNNWTLDATADDVTVVANSVVLDTVTNEKKSGTITVTKKIEGVSNPSNVDLTGWVIELYDYYQDALYGLDPIMTTTTNSSGIATFSGLKTDTIYYIREAPAERQSRSDVSEWKLSTVVSTVTVTDVSQPVTAEITNEKKPGSIVVTKKITGAEETEENLQGWVIDLYTWDIAAVSGVHPYMTGVTDKNGRVVFNNLPSGRNYYVREAPASRQTRDDVANWTLDVNSKSVGVFANQASSVTVTNSSKGVYIRIQKVSSFPECMEQLEGNNLYTFKGAVFRIYNTDGTYEDITSDANGVATSTKLYKPDTTYTVEEITAPSGFLKATGTKSFTTNNPVDGVCSFEFADTPVSDPAFVAVKVDKDTGDAQGNATFESAVFKMEYFTNYTCSGTPERTWYFRTNSAGRFGYNVEFLAEGYSSDALYDFSPNPTLFQQYALPLGSIRITEIEYPNGYASIPVIEGYISQSTEGGQAKFDWYDETWDLNLINLINGIYEIDEPLGDLGKFDLVKKDAELPEGYTQGNVLSLRAKFQVTNMSSNAVKIGDFEVAEPGAVCYEFWTDDEGYFSSEAIFPIGSYKITEQIPPEGMQLNADWEETFEVTSSSLEFSFTTAESMCVDSVIRGGVEIIKYDALLGEETPETVDFSGITYSVYNISDNAVIVDGVRYETDEVVATMALEWDDGSGKWTARLDGETLPYGTYRVVENSMEEGGIFANDDYLVVDDQGIVREYTFNIVTDGEIVKHDSSEEPVEMIFANVPVGRIALLKVNHEGKVLQNVKFLLEWSTDGRDWMPVKSIPVNTFETGGSVTQGIINGCLVTDAEGKIAFEGLDVSVQYRLTEVDTLEGYQLLAEPVYTGILSRNADFKVEVSCKVTNSPIFIIPQSGSIGFTKMSLGLAICVLGFLSALVYLRKKEEA